MTADERRREILEALSIRRSDTVENLAFEFDVSVRTIRYDVERLSLNFPVYTRQGNGGGVYVTDTFRAKGKYLSEVQRELLERLIAELTGEDKKTLESIIRVFGLPAREVKK